MKIFKILLFAIFLALGTLIIYPVYAGPVEVGPDCPRPYGGYCQGPRWGWYGANKPVTTAGEARKYLEKYFEKENVIIGTITDSGLYFKAEIKDRNNSVIDQVVIYKRTGRIRSIE
jgi:hypothetical protein